MFGSMGVRAAAAASLAVVVSAASAQAAASVEPKITLKPRSLRVNTEAVVRGRGFAPNTTIRLADCGRTFWMAPDDPCVSEEPPKTVTTDGKGRFQTSFTVGLCPEGAPTKKATQRVCYVGRLVTGEDTASLTPAAKLVVTYP